MFNLLDPFLPLVRIISEMLILKKISDDKRARERERDENLNQIVTRNVWKAASFSLVTSLFLGEVSSFTQNSISASRKAELLRRKTDMIVSTIGQDMINGDIISVLASIASVGEMKAKLITFGGTACTLIVLGEYLGSFIIKTLKIMSSKILKFLSEQKAIDAVIVDEARLLAKAERNERSDEDITFSSLSRDEFTNLAKAKAAKQYDQYKNDQRRKIARRNFNDYGGE